MTDDAHATRPEVSGEDAASGGGTPWTMGTSGTEGVPGAAKATGSDATPGSGGLDNPLGTGGEPDRRGTPYQGLPDEDGQVHRAPGYSTGGAAH